MGISSVSLFVSLMYIIRLSFLYIINGVIGVVKVQLKIRENVNTLNRLMGSMTTKLAVMSALNYTLSVIKVLKICRTSSRGLIDRNVIIIYTHTQ